jgi:single-stranded-DNA-specific exonuclease
MTNELMNLGYTKVQASILANRIDLNGGINRVADYTVNTLDFNSIHKNRNLMDMEKGVGILKKHIEANNHIVIVSDYDADGVTSAVVLTRGLTEVLGSNNVTTKLNHRKNGNGVNQTIINELVELHETSKIDLIITSDHGSSDDVRYKTLKDMGIEIIVTDHHELPATGLLKNADAFINPKRPDCNSNSNISGCAVAWYLLYNTMLEMNGDAVKCRELLSYVAVSTIADAMILNDPLNRTLYVLGVIEINKIKHPVWDVYKSHTGVLNVDDNDIGFNLAPLINSASRTGCASDAYNYLMSETHDSALLHLCDLEKINADRKKNQNRMIADARQYIKDHPFEYSNIIRAKDGLGVIGIVSGNIGEMNNKPTVTFAPKGDSLSGSGRAIVKGFDLRKIYQQVHEADNSIVIAFGGHKAAAGCTIHVDKFDDFCVLFDKFSKIELDSLEPDTNEKAYDIELDEFDINLSLLEEVNMLRPYGNGFPTAKFKSRLRLTFLNKIKDKFLITKFSAGNMSLEGFMMVKDKSIIENTNIKRLKDKKYVDVIFSINTKVMHGNTILQLFLEDIW